MRIFDWRGKLKQHCRPNLRPDQQIPQFESAIKRNSASYSQLLDVSYGMNSREDEQREIYRAYHPCIEKAFEHANGNILHSYRSSTAKAGVVLTERAFFAHYDFKKSESRNDFTAQELLIKCDRLAIEARRFLSGSHLHVCSELIYSAAENLLQFIDDHEKDTKKSDEIDKRLILIKEQLDYAEGHHKELLPLAYQRDYYHGMIMGFFGISFFFVIIGILIWYIQSGKFGQTNEKLLDYELLMASLIGGGLGAIVSMMSRLSSGEFGLEGRVGPTALKLAGILRPFIGAIFGAVIFAVIESGLISHINPNNENGNKLLFYAALGFVAGFSERWVPEMLSVAVKAKMNGSDNGKGEQGQTEKKDSAPQGKE